MKKSLILAAAVIAALSACTKEEIAAPKTETAEASVFTATIEPETKTTLVGGKKVYWSNGDKININGKVYSTTSTTGTATFTAVDGGAVVSNGKYIAAYPSTVTVSPETSALELPYWQYYDTNPNGIKSVPMVAVSTSTNLEFKNVCALLAIKVASGTVKRILVKADNKCLSGAFKLNSDTYGLEALGGKNTVGLYCSKAVTANNTTFYIAIPAQEYSSLQIYIAADDENYKEVMATKAPAGLGTLERNKIFNITFQANAVQLWKDGPYFATENVGGTNEYRWGAELPTGSAGWNSGSYDKEHDTAYKVWGSAWRMPTKSEFEALISNSTITYSSNSTAGFTFTSTTSGYGSIFLPEQKSSEASYWSSTADPDKSSNAYELYLKKTTTLSVPIKTVITSEVTSYSRGGALPVRAVIATPTATPAAPDIDSNLTLGQFSVSATKKVQFTKRNVYWDGSELKFESKAYDRPTTWSSSHVGHFFWGKTLAESCAETFAGNTTSEFFASGVDSSHRLTVEGTSGLYVLSSDEWAYIFEVRPNFADLYKRRVSVAGVYYSVVFAPDDYDFTNHPLKDNYTAEEWVEAESLGVVCLPTTGRRDGTSLQYTSTNGRYCSSTLNSEGKVERLFFGSTNIYYAEKLDKNVGAAIRLVKTVK